MLRRLILGLGTIAALGAAVAFAAENAEHPEEHHFSFEGPFGHYDMAAVQRGFAVYKQVCAACHSMHHLSYDDLGREGGPFAAYRVIDHETGEPSIQLGIHPGQHGTLVGINDNPFVRAIADDVQITDLDDTGQPMDRPGRPSDHFRSPFPNEAAARAANGGAYPPDLSEITSARHGGAEYIRSLLMGYSGEQESGKYVNRYFPGHLIGMPPPLADGIVTYDDGAPNTNEAMATDVAHFLQWAADPHMEKRKSTGFVVMIFLLALAGLLYLSYKQVWKGEKH